MCSRIVTKLLVIAALAAVETLASPLAEPAPAITPAPSLTKRNTCTFSGSDGASKASVSQRLCSTIVLSNVAVPSGVTLDLSKLVDGTTVIFQGETTWGYKEWAGPLLQISGNRITVNGNAGSGATLNGGGARWWDGKGDKGKVKPKFFAAHSLTASTITDVHILNTPVQAVSVSGCNGLNITGMTIDDSAGDTQGGHNTDGFDIGTSSGVNIVGANVYNQDDCVAVNSGSDITFSNGLCSGGHGLSIGSVGGRSDNTVNKVTFQNSHVKNSVNGIRVKATEGKTGTIAGVTYSGITLAGISGYGILIEQNYNGGDLKGNPTSGIPITNLSVENISGAQAVSSSGYDVVIVCGTGACTGWTWTGVTVTGGKKYGGCQNVPSGIACS